MSFFRLFACHLPIAILLLHCGPAEETTSSTSTDEAATGAGAVGTTGEDAAGGASSSAGGMGGGNTAGAGGDAGAPGPPDPDGPLTAVLDGAIPYAFGDISGVYPLEVDCLRMADGRPARFHASAGKDEFGDLALRGSVAFEVPHVLTGEVDESSEMIVRFGLKLDEDDFFFLEAGLNRGAYTAVVSVNDMQSAGRFSASGHITELWGLSSQRLFPADVRFWVDGVFEGGCP